MYKLSESIRKFPLKAFGANSGTNFPIMVLFETKIFPLTGIFFIEALTVHFWDFFESRSVVSLLNKFWCETFLMVERCSDVGLFGFVNEYKTETQAAKVKIKMSIIRIKVVRVMSKFLK